MQNLPQEPIQAIEELIKVNTLLAQEHDLNRLLDRIVMAARSLTGAETGWIYLLHSTKRKLLPEVLQSDFPFPTLAQHEAVSLFIEDEPNNTDICSFCAFSGRLVNLPDIYQYSGFDFSGTYHYDKRVGYRTCSVLAVPLRDHQETTIGVLQLVNKREAGEGAIIPFPSELESLVVAFASQAAVAVKNVRLIEENRHLIAVLNHANKALDQENAALRERMKKTGFDSAIIGDSPAMRRLFSLIEKVVDSSVAVMVRGETGTGKELVSAAIHNKGVRRSGPFIAQNCAALPESLLESELFGYRRGAFSGAEQDKQGLIAAANGGTLFLDEVGDMPLLLQAKLLRVIEEGELRPLGGVESIPVDVRIVAATHKDLEAMLKSGLFREDLYYRLTVFPIEIPPLRERKEDLPLLAGHFLQRFSQRHGKPIKGFSPAALDLLLNHNFPGNIRELKNGIERAVLLTEQDGSILPEHLPASWGATEVPCDPFTLSASGEKGLKAAVAQFESHYIESKLAENGGNQTHTAREIGVSRRTLVEKISRYRIKR